MDLVVKLEGVLTVPDGLRGGADKTIAPENLPNPSEVIVGWLGGLDPRELDEAVLARLGGFGGPSPMEAALAVLRDWASGCPA